MQQLVFAMQYHLFLLAQGLADPLIHSDFTKDLQGRLVEFLMNSIQFSTKELIRCNQVLAAVAFECFHSELGIADAD